jgi:hypothetical protein
LEQFAQVFHGPHCPACAPPLAKAPLFLGALTGPL